MHLLSLIEDIAEEYLNKGRSRSEELVIYLNDPFHTEVIREINSVLSDNHIPEGTTKPIQYNSVTGMTCLLHYSEKAPLQGPSYRFLEMIKDRVLTCPEEIE